MKSERPRSAITRGQQPAAESQQKGGGLFKKFFSKLAKNEEKHRNYLATKSIKLPKNFANMVLDQELKIEGGHSDFENVNALLQMYSVSILMFLTHFNCVIQRAVEYYSGMNDEKYIYFTERIQNLLCRPDILKMMSSHQAQAVNP